MQLYVGDYVVIDNEPPAGGAAGGSQESVHESKAQITELYQDPAVSPH